MLVALHDISIRDAATGESYDFARGDVIPAKAQKALPARRLEQLKGCNMVEEITDEASIAKAVEALTERVEALEAQGNPPALEAVADAPATRTPRKRKAA